MGRSCNGWLLQRGRSLGVSWYYLSITAARVKPQPQPSANGRLVPLGGAECSALAARPG